MMTTLTNPGIIDRLEQDIADYLSPFGFRLERLFGQRPQLQQNDGVVVKNDSSSSSSSSRAVLVIPHIPYNYSTTNNGTKKNNGIDDAIAGGSNTTSTSFPATTIRNEHQTTIPNNGNADRPIGTLHLHIHQESLLSTVGPLLRTFLRLSPHQMSPLRLRSVIHCHFVLDALEKFEKMNAEQQRNQLIRQEELSARRMAHHVHMLVRNSMGSALCLEVVVVLPCYWRRSMHDGNGREESTAAAAGEKVPISLESVLSAMRDNPDACYPSVQLVEQGENGVDDVVDNACNSSTCSSTAIHLDVRTRMCTVRHQPLLFRWVSSLHYPSMANNDGQSVLCNERVDSYNNGQQLLDVHPTPFDEIFNGMPLVVACIEKVGNLHRILMLCHDYDKMHHCTKSDGSKVQNNDAQSSLLSNVIVILPNTKVDGQAQREDGKGKNGEIANDKTLRDFETAFDHFHKVIIDPQRGNSQSYHRPTFVYEEHAAEKIATMIQQRPSYATQSISLSRPSIIGIDLHPDALTLHGDYVTSNPPAPTNQAAPPALQTMRNADAIVFGYESTGIPETIAKKLNGWVQIPSRSSINVVAAMSIVLDALLGAGAGVDTKLMNNH